MTSQPLSCHRYFANLGVADSTGRSPYRAIDLMIFITLCVPIAHADTWLEIEAFARARRDWLARFCRLPLGDDGQPITPSHDTLERLFKRLDPHAFGRCFGRWTAALAEGLGLKQVAIDGKTLRGSAQPAKGIRPLHVVSAWATANHLSLAQVAVEQKSNEITAIPELLRLLDLKGALVSSDAMGCQKAIAGQIRDLKLWPGLATVGLGVYEREINGVLSTEYHYFISSRKGQAEDFAQALRGHWGVENNCHWQLDIALGEDDNQVANRNSAQNLSVVRRLALSLIKQTPAKSSIKTKRYKASVDSSFLEKVLLAGQTG